MRTAKVLFFAIAGIMLISGAMYALFFSPWARIASIDVSGTQIVPVEDIVAVAHEIIGERIWGIVPRDSFLFFPQAALADAILHAFPRIASVAIERPSPQTAIIHAQERAILGIWCPAVTTNNKQQTTNNDYATANSQGGGCAFFDDRGIIFDYAPSATRGRLFWVLEDMRVQELPGLGAEVLHKDFLLFLQGLRKDLGALLGESLLSWRIEQNGEVHIRVTDSADIFGWYIYFSSTYDATYQVRVLERVLEEEIGEDKRPYLEYIDLRVKNKVFYKLH